jgi:hypothetical protein
MQINNPSHPNYFENIEFLIEATYYEVHILWLHWAREAQGLGTITNTQLLNWDNDTGGRLEQIGFLDGRPVNLSMFGATINGHRVLFYEAVSQVVDYKQVEEWLEKTFPKLLNEDTHQKANADNFTACVHYLTQ